MQSNSLVAFCTGNDYDDDVAALDSTAHMYIATFGQVALLVAIAFCSHVQLVALCECFCTGTVVETQTPISKRHKASLFIKKVF